MNLTSLSETSEFKELTSQIELPNFDVGSVIVQPDRKNGSYPYSLVGTTFDYLLQFQIELKNPNRQIYKSGELVAEKEIKYLDRQKQSNGH